MTNEPAAGPTSADHAASPKFDLQHARYERIEGNLCYFVSQRTTVLLASEEQQRVYQICQITFHRTGAIFVQFPYFQSVVGLVGRMEVSVHPNQSSEVHFGEFGKVSSSVVKYSHPPDGNVHFSQDGKVYSQIRSKSFDLRRHQGHLFEAHIVNLSGFRALAPGQERRNRLYLPYGIDRLPPAVTIVGEWIHKAYLRERTAGRGGVFGPIGLLPRDADGRPYLACLVGQPTNTPLQDHLLMLSLSPAPLPTGATDPRLIFMGGWQSDNPRPRPGDTVTCLAFMYPCNDPEHFRRTVGTIDYAGNQGNAAADETSLTHNP